MEGNGRRASSRSRLILFRALTVTLTSLVLLAALEVGLRATRSSHRFFPYHANWGRVSYPSEEITPGVSGPSYFTTNSVGTRGPEFADQRVRILTIGGSTTACTVLDDSETWPALLMTYLNEYAGDQGSVWVTNSGIDGKNSHHHVMHTKYLIPELPELDYVIIYAGMNDVGMWLFREHLDPHFLDDPDNWNSRVGEAFRVSNYTQASYPWYKHLELWKRASVIRSRLQTAFLARQDQPGEIIQDVYYEWMERERAERQEHRKRFVRRAKMETLPAALGSYERNLRLMIELVREAGGEPILMAQAMTNFERVTEEELRQEERQQWLGAMDGGETYVSLHQMAELVDVHNKRMQKVCEDEGVTFIDLPALLEHERDLFIDGHHFNEHGARVTARAIADFLRKTVFQ